MMGAREAWMMGAREMSAQIPRPIGTIAFTAALLTLALGVDAPANRAFAVDCLTAPNSSTPANGHWYYRTDRTQERKCWYLRTDSAPSERVAVQAAREAPAKPSQSVAVGGSSSLASFKIFVAQNGGAKLSDQDVEKLYAEFLEWKRRAKN
jgi:hypothetical protein